MPRCASTPRASASSSRSRPPAGRCCWPECGRARSGCPASRGSATRPPGWPELVGEGGATQLVCDLLARCTFPPPGTPVACAVSGGADSLALLVLAAAACCGVTAYHVDHGLRAGSDTEAEVVAGAAERVGARFESRRVSVAPGPNLEARARSARYGTLPAGVA